MAVTKDELANLSGFYSAYDDQFKVIAQSGTVPVSTIYSDARTIIDTHKEAAEAAKKLRAAGDKFASFFERMDAKKGSK